jgi:uncharacterized membrane-anchored protein YitT (DUF2179 family)
LQKSKGLNFSRGLLFLNSVILIILFIIYTTLCGDGSCYQYDNRLFALFVVTVSTTFSILLFEFVLRIDPIIPAE